MKIKAGTGSASHGGYQLVRAAPTVGNMPFIISEPRRVGAPHETKVRPEAMFSKLLVTSSTKSLGQSGPSPMSLNYRHQKDTNQEKETHYL